MPETQRRLNDDEIEAGLRNLPEWAVRDGKLTRSFKFPDFVGGVGFVNRVSEAAEAQGHHPDLFVTWGEVIVYLTSHSAGGLTAKDFDLAGTIEGLAR